MQHPFIQPRVERKYIQTPRCGLRWHVLWSSSAWSKTFVWQISEYTVSGQKYFFSLKFHYIFHFHDLKTSPKSNIKCIFRLYAEFTQGCSQMCLLVLFYIFFESQFMNYMVDYWEMLIYMKCLRLLSYKILATASWLIDWIAFNAVSAIFQPCNRGDY